MAYSTRSVFSAVSGFFGDIGRARTMAHTYDHLARLSDAELAHRGLTRGDLVREAARRCGF